MLSSSLPRLKNEKSLAEKAGPVYEPRVPHVTEVNPASAGQRIRSIALCAPLCDVSKVKRVWLKRPDRFMSYKLAHVTEVILPLQGSGL